MANNDALKLHDLRPAPGAKTAKTRVGRGEGSKGKTAGRGTKGTKARYQVPHGFEGGQTPMHMRLPKPRGFKNPAKVTFQVVNLDKLSALFRKAATSPSPIWSPRALCARSAGQGSGHGRDHCGDQHHRRQVLGLRAREDQGRGRQRHRGLIRSAPCAESDHG